MKHVARIAASFVSVTLFVLMTFGTTALAGVDDATASGVEGRTLLAGLFGSTTKSQAPDFDLQDLKGTPVKLSQFRGDRPVLLYFWATWCPSCSTMKPHLAKVREKVPEKDLQILGINVGEGDSLEKVKRYQEGHPSPWPTLYDAGSKVARSYRVQGIPLFVLIDKEGMIVYQGNDLPQDPLQILKK
ncbi:MAG: TlpA family protein disulfide reductase [Syntrophobacteraceae bacterium]|jgi:peroxiredoxin|nr:TlpA family protein disulfide reductase [Syntrophobacteraceae bacterium]